MFVSVATTPTPSRPDLSGSLTHQRPQGCTRPGEGHARRVDAPDHPRTEISRSHRHATTRGRDVTASTHTITIDTPATPDVVYALLRAVSAVGTWLPRSPIYRGTTVAVSAADGTYVDHTPLGALTGRLEAATPHERLEFLQSTADHALSIRIVYEISPSGAGARIARTGTISTAGRLRWLHPFIVAVTRWENRRTMAQLRAALDPGRGPLTSSTPTG